jgi:hypothetical protein
VDLAAVPGLAECALPAAVAASLPPGTPPAPWDCRVRAVVWVQRGECPLPPGWPVAVRGALLGAVVEYVDSPVGSYREVFAGPFLRSAIGITVPFIAVDSLPSVAGGREHWSLPKGLAVFSGDVREEVRVEGDAWSVDVRTRRLGMPLPARASFRADQGRGPAAVSLRGRTALARVSVDAVGPSLTGWLGSGRHLGVVGEGRLLVGPPVTSP